MVTRLSSLYTLVLVLVLALSACKKDDFANETVNELNKLADDIVAKVKEAEDPKVGIESAQKILDERRPQLQPAMAEVMKLRGHEVSEETAANVNRVRTDAGMKVASLMLDGKLMAAATADEEVNKKLEALADGFTDLVDGK